MNEIIKKLNGKVKQSDIVPLYAALICSGEKDFGEVNRAIMSKWSKAGLVRIKTDAWKIIEVIR